MSYRMSFTSASLLVQESLVLAQTYRSLGDWKQVKTISFEQNLLQACKPKSAKTYIHELIGRLSELTAEQLELLLDGSRSDQLCMLWLAVCKRYRFVKEFGTEVVREKFLMLDHLVTTEDYSSFFNSKAEWDEGLESLSASTCQKVRQVVFHMLRDAEILSSSHMIIPGILSPEVVLVIQSDDLALFAIYPVSDIDIQEWTR